MIPDELPLPLQISIQVAWRSGGLLGLLRNFQARSCLGTCALRMRHIPQMRYCMTAWRCWSLASHLEQLRRVLAYINKKVLKSCCRIGIKNVRPCRDRVYRHPATEHIGSIVNATT